MPMDDGEHQPRPPDKIWYELRAKLGKQPNGKIVRVFDYGPDGSVLVQWYAGDKRWQATVQEEHEEITTDELKGKYSRRYKCYYLYLDDRTIRD